MIPRAYHKNSLFLFIITKCTKGQVSLRISFMDNLRSQRKGLGTNDVNKIIIQKLRAKAYILSARQARNDSLPFSPSDLTASSIIFNKGGG